MYRFIHLLTRIIRQRSATTFALLTTLALLGMTSAASAQPAISIVSPAAGSTISGTVPVTFKSQIGIAAVAKVEYYVGNTLLCTGTSAPDYACTATYSWNPDTTYEITAKAYNKQGKPFPTQPKPILINIKPPQPPAIPVPLYRLYHPTSINHFYTRDAGEADRAATKLGYNREGVCCKVLASQAEGAVPLYRAYQPTRVDHFYTTNKAEVDNAVSKLGYQAEGVAGYIYSTQHTGTIPLYRAYQPTRVDHFYTTNKAEVDNAVSKLGYQAEGITGYVYPAQ